MQRDLKRYVADYQQTFLKKNGRRGAFYMSDVEQIVEMSNDLVVAAYCALQAGFMVGYRAAKAEARRKTNV